MLKIVGDINFTDGFFDTGFGIGSAILNGENPFKHIERHSKDFWIGNFECVCATTSNKKGIYKKQFIISPKCLCHLKHLDLYSVANNHVMQHGDIAYREMLDYLKREQIYYVGSDKHRYSIIEHQNKKIAVFSFSMRPENFAERPLYWSQPECIEIKNEIAKLKECDFKMLYVHWGNEFINYPYSDQKQFAHFLIDIGFDLIIGVHPHVLQGYEVYNGKYIFYSLGNFVFNMPWEPTKYSVIVNVDFREELPNVSWEYVKIGRDSFPACIEDKEVPETFHFDNLNSLLSKTEENERYYSNVFRCMRNYRKANYCDILRNIYKFKFSDIQQILCDFVKRKLN